MRKVNVHVHTPHLIRRDHTATSVPRAPASAGGGFPLLWLGAGAMLFFLVPFVGTDRLELQPDLYYLGYFTLAVAFFATFVTMHASALMPLWTEHLWQSLRFGFQIVWRGLIYGSVDALTLYVFPAAVAYLLLRGNRKGLRRKAAFAGLALVLSLLMTTTYHLGYSEYRGGTIKSPEIGALVANVPTALTGNPVGAVLTHGTMHISAVLHQNEGGAQHMLPPKVTGDYASHGSSDLAAVLAAGWLLAAAGALTLLVRRSGHQVAERAARLP